MYSIWPYFVEMTLLFALVASPLFRAADVPRNLETSRISTLDGLRGFLALGVFFHHATIYNGYLKNGLWVPPPGFYALLGQGGVAMFFMITGFLFWSRIIREGDIDWTKLYIGRLFRIGPLYLFAVVCALSIVAARTGFALHVPVLSLIKELTRWLSLGFLNLIPFNGDEQAPVLLKVSWTLQYEWMFYISLPVLAFIAGRSRWHLLFAAAALAVSTVYVMIHPLPLNTPICLPFFLIGMTSASLLQEKISLSMPNWVSSIIAFLAIGTFFFLFQSAYSVGPVLFLGTAFYLFASGTTLFGLLTSRAARRIGAVSYGIYLLHCLILGGVFSFGPLREVALASPYSHWTIVLVCAILLVILATAAHVLVERPGIDLGKLIANSVRSTRQGRKPITSPAESQ